MNAHLENELRVIFNAGNAQSFEGLETSCSANSAAEVSELLALSSSMDFTPPEDYIEFLKLYNGCELFNYDNIDGFRFFSSNEFLEQNGFQKKNYGEDWQTDVVLFCECIGEGNFLAFKITNESKYYILDCFREEPPSNWRVIGESFDSFLEQLLSFKGEKFWLRNL